MSLLKKYSLPALTLTAAMTLASTAQANHGAEYILSACDKNGDMTANLSVTTIGEYTKYDGLNQMLQIVFNGLMAEYSVEDHLRGTPEYLADMKKSFVGLSDYLIENHNRSPEFDLKLPNRYKGGSMTPGCN